MILVGALGCTGGGGGNLAGGSPTTASTVSSTTTASPVSPLAFLDALAAARLGHPFPSNRDAIVAVQSFCKRFNVLTPTARAKAREGADAVGHFLSTWCDDDYLLASDARIYPTATVAAPPPTFDPTWHRGEAACDWRAEVVDGGGTSGFHATVVGLENARPTTCPLPSVAAVWGAESNGEWVKATSSSYFPVGRAPVIVARDARVELVVSTERLDDCAPIATSRPVESLVLRLDDGATLVVALDDAVEAGCSFGYSKIGSWD
jgi:hypothetical protein